VSKIKMIILDVDGTLTDGGIILGPDIELKRFDVQDGMGIALARSVGLAIGIITGRRSTVVENRAAELGITDLHQGISDKNEVLDQILLEKSLGAENIAYIGDDLPDIPVMRKVGLPIAVQNAVVEVKQCCFHVTRATGGHGAIREAIDWILDLRGDKSDVYNRFYEK